MDFHPEKALEHLKELLQTLSSPLPEELSLLEMRLAKNRKDARLFGEDDPANRSELNRILYELNRFAQDHTSMSFTEFFQTPSPDRFPSTNGHRLAKSETSSLSVLSHVDSPDLGTKKRWAVLVGVGNYVDKAYSALPTCINDASEVARQLYSNEDGFTSASIHILIDDGIKPTRRAILERLQQVADAAEEDDLLLFYYSGHGELEHEECYLVTNDSTFGHLKETALSVARVEEIMQASRAKAKVMILDACHAGANLQSKGAGGLPPKFLERVYLRARGMAIFASCEQHQKSYVWETKKCSAYTYFLLEALSGKADREEKGFVSIDDIDAHVINGMASWTERHGYTQTPTKHFEGYGRIIVSRYKMQSHGTAQQYRSPETKAPQQPKLSSFTHAPAWAESETVVVCGEAYILCQTIQEKPTPDGSAVLRSAQAQHALKGYKVQLKQACLFRQTSQGNELCRILRKEHQLALKLAQYREFPRILDEEGITGESDIAPITLVYEAWAGPAFRDVFHQPGRALTGPEIITLIRSFVQVCEIIGVLHRERCSHRALTADSILFLGGDKRRPVLRDFGFAAYPTRLDGKNVSQIAAPEQLHNTPELGLPGLRTDIYQLGVILYETITGQPFSSSKPSVYAQAIPPAIDDSIMRAVSRLPQKRWPTISAFASSIKQALTKDRFA